jgi:hypothetical protein
VPVVTDDPAALRAALAAAGVDASGASNVTALGGARARAMIERVVFVPAYPEIDELDRALRGRIEAIVGAHLRAQAVRNSLGARQRGGAAGDVRGSAA